MTNFRTFLLACLVLAGTAVHAVAQEPASPAAAVSPADAAASAAPEAAPHEPNVTVGLKLGLYLPNLFNHMGTNGLYSLDVAYLLPFWSHRLGIQFEAGFAPPTNSGSRSDPRIGDSGGTVTYSQTTNETQLSLGPILRFLPPSARLVPYAGLAARIYLLKTHVTGSAGGNAFGANDEVSTQYGFVGTVGAEYHLGPGKLLLEAAMGWSHLPHVTTGSTTTSALVIQAGYRLAF